MTVRQRMLALKASYEPSTTLGLFRRARLPSQDRARPAARPSGQPRDRSHDQCARAGRTVDGRRKPAQAIAELGAPDRRRRHGRVDILLCGARQFGLMTDAALTPDPEALVSRFPEEFEKYLYSVAQRDECPPT